MRINSRTEKKIEEKIQRQMTHMIQRRQACYRRLAQFFLTYCVRNSELVIFSDSSKTNKQTITAKRLHAEMAMECEKTMAHDDKITALCSLASCGDVQGMQMLIKIGVHVNALHETRRGSALTVATARGQLQSVKLLIESGADVNLPAAFGVTALMNAAWGGHTKCLAMLIDAAADVNACDCDGQTALMSACRTAQENCAQLLLKAGAKVNDRDKNGNSALTIAIEKFCDCATMKCLEMWAPIKVVQLLLEKGSDVNLQLADGRTVQDIILETLEALPLQHGCHTSIAFLVKLLITAGEHINLNGFSIRKVILHGENGDTDFCPQDDNSTLKALCRQAIRRHLINTDIHCSLIMRIPLLSLPRLFASYLLYNMPRLSVSRLPQGWDSASGTTT